MLKILIDENMPRSLCRKLSEVGFQTVDIRDVRPFGVENGEIFALAKEEQRVSQLFKLFSISGNVNL